MHSVCRRKQLCPGGSEQKRKPVYNTSILFFYLIVGSHTERTSFFVRILSGIKNFFETAKKIFFLIYFHALPAVSHFIVLMPPTDLAAHSLCCQDSYCQTKANLETEAYIVAYILPNSSLFHILHL